MSAVVNQLIIDCEKHIEVSNFQIRAISAVAEKIRALSAPEFRGFAQVLEQDSKSLQLIKGGLQERFHQLVWEFVELNRRFEEISRPRIEKVVEKMDKDVNSGEIEGETEIAEKFIKFSQKIKGIVKFAGNFQEFLTTNPVSVNQTRLDELIANLTLESF